MADAEDAGGKPRQASYIEPASLVSTPTLTADIASTANISGAGYMGLSAGRFNCEGEKN